MADENVVQDFLVKLGFKIDEPELRKFSSMVEGATKFVFGLAAALETTAVGVAIGTARMARDLEQVYFASKRAGSSATDLEALGRAAQDFGASAGDAQNAVENLAHFMRVNFGGETRINQFAAMGGLGEITRDTNGALRDTTDILMDLGRAFAKQPYPVAFQEANSLGISEKMLLALENGDFARQVQKMRSALNAGGFDKAAKDAHEFEESMRDLSARIDAIKVQVGNGVLKALKPELDDLLDWFNKHGKELGEQLKGLGENLESLGKGSIPIFNSIFEGWKNIFDWAKAGGEALVQSLPSDTEDSIGRTVASLLDKLGYKQDVPTDSSRANPNAKSAVSLMSIGSGDDSGRQQNKSDTPSPSRTVAQWLEDFVYGHGLLSRKSQALNYFEGKGWTKEQAEGIVSNLDTKSGLNPYAVGDHGDAYGIAQWHADRLAKFKKWTGLDIHDATYSQQLGFVEHELEKGGEFQDAGTRLAAAINAMDATRVVSQYYERPAGGRAEANRRASTTFHQETNITVSGVHDPAAAGREVARQQDQVNANVVRNIKAPVE